MLYVPTVMLYFVGVSVYVLGPGHQPCRQQSYSPLDLWRCSRCSPSQHSRPRRRQVDQQPRRHRHLHRRRGPDRPRHRDLVALRHHHHRRRFQDSRQPALRSQFLRRDLLRPGRPRTRFRHGRRNQDPSRTLPGAVAWGGVLSGALYVGATLTLLIAIGKNVNVLQGSFRPSATWPPRRRRLDHRPVRAHAQPLDRRHRFRLDGRLSRIPFVAGLDSYMPSWLGKVHPRYATPYAALIVQAIVSGILVIMNFTLGAGVQETFQKLLSLAVVCNSFRSFTCSARW
jgi:hypothetical protein